MFSFEQETVASDASRRVCVPPAAFFSEQVPAALSFPGGEALIFHVRSVPPSVWSVLVQVPGTVCTCNEGPKTAHSFT